MVGLGLQHGSSKVPVKPGLRVENNLREIDFEETSAKEYKAGEIRQNTGKISCIKLLHY